MNYCFRPPVHYTCSNGFQTFGTLFHICTVIAARIKILGENEKISKHKKTYAKKECVCVCVCMCKESATFVKVTTILFDVFDDFFVNKKKEN